jgi:hypothetical protein
MTFESNLEDHPVIGGTRVTHEALLRGLTAKKLGYKRTSDEGGFVFALPKMAKCLSMTRPGTAIILVFIVHPSHGRPRIPSEGQPAPHPVYGQRF